jgi:hypothetical protein
VDAVTAVVAKSRAIVPDDVIGEPDDVILPAVPFTDTLVTVPAPADPELAEVILPLLSTVIVDSVYVPATTPVVDNAVVKLPTPPPVTSPNNVIVWSPVFVPELVPEKLLPLIVPTAATEVGVIAPRDNAIVPLVVIGELDTLMPLAPEIPTEVTVPPPAIVAQDTVDPFVVKNLPELPVCVGISALIAPDAVVCPVPPLAITNVPPIVSVPVVVIGPPVNDNPVAPPEPLTEVTVPVPEVILMLLTLVIRPLLSTVNTGTVVADPYVLAVTPVVDNDVAKLPVPVPVTSPLKVIVWSPVFVPELVPV